MKIKEDTRILEDEEDYEFTDVDDQGESTDQLFVTELGGNQVEKDATYSGYNDQRTGNEYQLTKPEKTNQSMTRRMKLNDTETTIPGTIVDADEKTIPERDEGLEEFKDILPKLIKPEKRRTERGEDSLVCVVIKA